LGHDEFVVVFTYFKKQIININVLLAQKCLNILILIICCLGYYKVLVVGGYSETGAAISSAEVIDLETSATACVNFTSFPAPFRGGVGGLGLSNEPLTCQGMNLITKLCY
jgi:hypothetical protein